MLEINVKSNIDELEKKFNLTLQQQQKAINRALNKVAEQAKVAAAREIRDAGYQIKAGDIKKSILISRAVGSNHVVTLSVSGKSIPLLAYGSNQTKIGVSVSVKNGRKLIRGAFIATMRSGHRGVFIRLPGLTTGKRGKPILNRKIKELFGPSIPVAFSNPIVIDSLRKMIGEKLPKLLKHEFEFVELSK